MFEGLEDEDFSGGNETFMPKKSIKKLVLKKGVSDGSSLSRSSSVNITETSQNQSLLEVDGEEVPRTP